jgi:glycogen operon protein
VEGATDDPDVQQLRAQRARNFMAVLLLSQGVPMFAAGDEALRSQRGNNNAYCQDSDLSWFDWSFTPGARAMQRFTREMIALRHRHPSLRRTRFLDGPVDGQPAEVQWYGTDLKPPDWHDADARVLCFTLSGVTPSEPPLHVMINMASTGRLLPLPQIATRGWRRLFDTTLTAPDDAVPAGEPVLERKYWLGPHGIAVFEA